MESLGEKLRSAREFKGLDFEHVGRETNIARRYLEALEAEDFSKFPGEPYILGFLRNYGEYLGLDAGELIGLYRSLRIQEQPIPVEELLKPHKSFPKGALIGIIIVVLAVVLGGAIYGIISMPKSEAAPPLAEHKPLEYAIEENYLERRFYIGDTVLVPLGADRFKLELASLDEGALVVSPLGNVALNLSEEHVLDLDGDSIGDVKITLSDYIRGDPAKGGLLRFELAAPPEAELPEIQENGDAPAVPEPVNLAAASPPIFSSPSAYPFTLQATFTGYCMFRWESDGRAREEMYFHKADVQNIQAQNGIRLWISNASAVRLQVIGGGRTVDLDVGGPGEVAVADLRWVRDDDGRFRLILVKLD
jgi:cytoskeletal protein RodZ